MNPRSGFGIPLVKFSNEGEYPYCGFVVITNFGSGSSAQLGGRDLRRHYAFEGENMKCPVDGRELAITHRDGIELDYCPECRGIWFDRGELDKVIERSNQQLQAAMLPKVDDRYERRSDDRDDDRYEKRSKDWEKKSYEYKPKKKKATSFLSDLLEFG